METKHGIVYYSEEDESKRLQELYSLDILFSKPEKSFDRITHMVSRVFDMPVVLVSLITADQQWFKSCVGLSGDLLVKQGTEREASFCQYVIAHKEPLIVHDALKDERFIHNRLVVNDPNIRFYAGAPLTTKNNHILGTLCVIDSQPRTFEPSQMGLLQQFAEIVIDEIEYREEIMARKKAEYKLKSSEERYKNLVEFSPELILVFQNNDVVYANPTAVKMLHLADKQPPYDADYLFSLFESNTNESLLENVQHVTQLNKSETLQKEYVLNRNEDTKVDTMVSFSKIIYNSQDAAMIIARDITYQKKTERLILEMNQKLQEISLKDGLTNIPNRRWMDDYLISEWRRAIRTGLPLSVILIDIDFFKRFNDTYGHLAGDQCLIQVADCIQSIFSRSSDFVARYGGEEFVVILPQTEQSAATHLAEKVRKGIELLQIPHDTSSVSRYVTVSLGVYTSIPTRLMNSHESLLYADKALYEAKHQGRNCLSVYSSHP